MAKEIVLSNGEKVEIKPFKGRHVIMAQSMAERYNDPETMIVPIILSLVCTFNGKPKTPEEILDLDGMDFLLLEKEVFGAGGVPKNLQSSSSTSSGKEDSQTVN